jgi:hypothetical protein
VAERAFSDHNTIANFRKDNPKPFLVFSTVKLASHFELIGGSLVATVLNSGLKTPRK